MLPTLETVITIDENMEALFSIPNDKAPSLDGYTSLFFKRRWGILSSDFIDVVKYFFELFTLPKCVNATRIALVPKVENHVTMNDFRPLSYCNVMYKYISKVIVSRLQLILPNVIRPSQTAFLPWRQKSNVILLTQELIHNYNLPNIMSRCALKIDFRKAFDTVNWELILFGLRTIGIPISMIRWIEVYMSIIHFSVATNEELHGFFQSTRGIRQGDPMSSYLFVLVIEGLRGILREAVMDDFVMLSRLVINLKESHVFLSGMDDDLKTSLLDLLGFRLGSLSVKYFGSL